MASATHVKRQATAATHPPFKEMVMEAIIGGDRLKGVSLYAIKRAIMANHGLEDGAMNNTNIRLALKRLLAEEILVPNRRRAGHFKVPPKANRARESGGSTKRASLKGSIEKKKTCSNGRHRQTRY